SRALADGAVVRAFDGHSSVWDDRTGRVGNGPAQRRGRLRIRADRSKQHHEQDCGNGLYSWGLTHGVLHRRRSIDVKERELLSARTLLRARVASVVSAAI